MLKYLLLPAPPQEMFPRVKAADIPQSWNEDLIKMCLYLYLGLLPINHKLIHELAVVYTAATADIKRTVLRVLENPVRGMGMQSPELLTLVEDCPKGAETLVTRVIHILTDKAAPSPELVERVRDLYQKRVSDVRFLIPVLTGLKKKEVIQALPKLIKLNPIVVKEVFNRLLGGHGDASYTSPLTPAELLMSLHNIDPNKCDMKTIIKASNLCFSEKNIYTQEVLAVVLQALMEQTPLPTLFMRTVLQSLSMYPRLLGLVLNILQRLITKQVWKQKRVWEGFIRCCQRTKPQSFQVLLNLPTAQLKSVFESCPELREPMLLHVRTFTENQIAHIPRAIMNALEKDPLEEQRLAEQKEKELQEAKEKEEREKTAAVQKDVLVSIPVQQEALEPMETSSEQIAKEKEDIRLAEEAKRREAAEKRMKVAEERFRLMADEKARVEEKERKKQEAEKQKKPINISFPKKVLPMPTAPQDVDMSFEDQDSPENALAIAEDPEPESMDVSMTSTAQAQETSASEGESSSRKSRSSRSSTSRSSSSSRRSTRSRK